MTEQPPSAEAHAIAYRAGYTWYTETAREIDAFCERRVSAETERVNIEWEERTGLHRCDRPYRAPAERPAPEKLT